MEKIKTIRFNLGTEELLKYDGVLSYLNIKIQFFQLKKKLISQKFIIKEGEEIIFSGDIGEGKLTIPEELSLYFNSVDDSTRSLIIMFQQKERKPDSVSSWLDRVNDAI